MKLQARHIRNCIANWKAIVLLKFAVETPKQTMSPTQDFLAKITMTTAIAVYKVCSIIKSVPFALESNDSLRVRKFESRWKIWLWHLVNFLFYFAACFQFLTFIHTLTSGLRGNAFAVHTLYLMASLFGLVFMLSLYMKPDVCVLLLRQHDKLLQTIAGKESRFGTRLNIL